MTDSDYRLPRHVRLFRRLGRPVFRSLFRVLGNVKITGLENVPKDGPYLIAINHISIYDPPFIIAFWPISPEAVGAVDIWEKSGQSTLAKLYGGIQVHRGEYDRRLIEQMDAVLRSGRPLLIAPEGGRSHTPGLRKAYPGMAYMVNQLNVPTIPVGLIGTTEDYFHRAIRGERPTLEMRVGKPFKLPSVEGRGQERRENLQRNADSIMYQIAELLPPDYRGVYASRDDSPAETA